MKTECPLPASSARASGRELTCCITSQDADCNEHVVQRTMNGPYNKRTTMRNILLLWSAALCSSAPAQNWALINPAYAYNFNDDGTDTIKYQLRTIDMDTLSLDSMLYTLPVVAQPCSDCGDTCNLRLDVPQFFQRRCLATPLVWRFMDPLELVIIPKAPLGASWLFNPVDSIWGSVDDLTESMVLGAMDSIRTMTTSMQDTIRWTKDHGLVLWHMHNGPRYALIGIRGLNVGRIVPPLTAFYPYQPGDVVQAYESYSSNWQQFGWTYRYAILDRVDTPGHIEFMVEKYWRFWGQGSYYYGHDPAAQWVADSIATPALSSWPGQMVEVGQSVDAGPNYIVARHQLGPDGAYTITGADLGGQPLMIPLDSIPQYCMYAFMPYGNYYRLTTGLGSSWAYDYMVNGSGRAGIMGAIIGGDTIGTVDSEEYFHVGIEGSSKIAGVAFPNPNNGRFTLLFPAPIASDGFYSLYDTVGKQLFQRPLVTGRMSEEVDLSGYGKGIYVVQVTNSEGVCYERVIVQ